MAKILVADDEVDMAEMISEMLTLKGNYNVKKVHDGKSAIQESEKHDYDLFLLDVNMPEANGFEVCETLKSKDKYSDTPIIFLTGLKDDESKIKGLEAGANDFLTKPVNIDELHLRVNNMLKLHEYSKMLKNYNKELESEVAKKTSELRTALNDLEDANEKIKKVYINTIYRLSLAAEYKDPETGKHLVRMSSLAAYLSKLIGLSKDMQEIMYFTSPMHDIGKISVPDHILNKPGKLTEEEFEIVKEHTTQGYKILKDSESDILKIASEIALTHHENFNGTGYPKGLQGKEIPCSGRIIKILDVYDSLRSERVYKPPFSHQKTMDIITKGDGRVEPQHFDPGILSTFIDNEQKIKSLFEKINTSELDFQHIYKSDSLVI
ncbi:MAG: response regulator [Candidatus Marinimicrobia bacterium]|nr:response regulator [Candidatus Neomarinimicrobiota bacterium]